MSCGKRLTIDIGENGKILTKGIRYWGTMKLGIGNWSSHTVTWDSVGNVKFKRCVPHWKYLYYIVRDKKRLLLHQYEEAEFWECPLCARKGSWLGRINVWEMDKKKKIKKVGK